MKTYLIGNNMISLVTKLKRRSQRGFTILFAALIASLLLAVGAAIYAIISREIVFASVAKNSDFAFYIADTGIECAEYWDNDCTDAKCENNSAFAVDKDSNPPTSGIMCNGQDIADAAVKASPSTWPAEKADSAATTTFIIDFSAQSGTQDSCATVSVAKWSPAANVVKTKIVSQGYNTCDPNDPNRLERELQVTY